MISIEWLTERIGNLFKINLFSVYCNSVESAKVPICNKLSHSECKSLSAVNMLFSKTGSFISVTSKFLKKVWHCVSGGILRKFC